MTEWDDALFETLAAISEDLELRGVLERIVRAAVEVSGARYGALGVLSVGGHKLEDFIHEGVDDHTAELIGALPTGHGVLGRLIREPEPLVLERLSDHPDSVELPPGHPPMETFLGLPVRVGGKVFGNLYLTEKVGGGTFTDEDVRRVEALAGMAGSAIRNARTFAAEQASSRLNAATADLTFVALSGAPVDELLERVVGAALEVLGGRTAVLVTGAGGQLVVEHVVGEDDGRDPRLLAAAGEAGTKPRVYRGVVAAPLLDDDVAPGGVLVVAADGRLPDDAVATMMAVVEQARLALAYARARDRTEAIAVGSERNRIARDLHDTVIQRLFAAGLRLDAASMDAPEELVGELTAAIEEVDASIRDLRGLVAGLGGVLDVETSERLRSVVSTLSAVDTAIEPLRLEGPIDDLDAKLSSPLAAVLREAITNAARHARASSIVPIVAALDDRVEIVVTDNGVGPAPPTTERPDGSGLGLSNLTYRATELGGGCELRPGPGGRGARLTWWVPRSR